MSIHRTLQHESKIWKKLLKMWKHLLNALYFHDRSKFLTKMMFHRKKLLLVIFSKKIIATWIFPSDQIYCKNSLKKVFQVTKTEILLRQMERLLNIGMNHFCLLYCTDYTRIERMKLILPEPIRQFAKGRDM